MAKAKEGMRKIVAPCTLVVSAGKGKTREVPPGTEVELPEGEARQIEAAFASNATVGPPLKPGETAEADFDVEGLKAILSHLENTLGALTDRVLALEAASVPETVSAGDGAVSGVGDPQAAG